MTSLALNGILLGNLVDPKWRAIVGGASLCGKSEKTLGISFHFNTQYDLMDLAQFLATDGDPLQTNHSTD